MVTVTIDAIQEVLRESSLGSITLAQELETELQRHLVLSKEHEILTTGLAQSGGFLGLGGNLPKTQRTIYQLRIRDIEQELSGISRIAQALKLGYSPVSLSENFMVGHVDQKPEKNMRRVVWGHTQNVFASPMPEFAIEKYRHAKQHNIFEGFLVASADRSMFQEIPEGLFTRLQKGVASILSDPILVGLIKTGNEMKLQKWQSCWLLEGGHMFLIAQWDLSRDLAQMGQAS